MPLIKKSNYKASWLLFNGHLETVVPGMFRKSEELDYNRQRFELSDGDFVDIDWVQKGSHTLVVLLHGLEGNSSRYYMLHMGHKILKSGYDLLAFNCRSCSGEMNRNFKLYNHGDTDDLKEVVAYVAKEHSYENIVLVGFSMGGSQLIKYLGEGDQNLPSAIKGGVAISTPCDLTGSADALSFKGNGMYRKRFIKKLVKKIKIKAEQFPGKLDVSNIDDVEHFSELDNYSNVINGFKSTEAFNDYASAKNYIKGITLPVLLINAQNDPMLPKSCYPYEIARNHSSFYFETPKRGGHCGFYRPGEKETWLERRVVQFIDVEILQCS